MSKPQRDDDKPLEPASDLVGLSPGMRLLFEEEVMTSMAWYGYAAMAPLLDELVVAELARRNRLKRP